MSFIILDLIKCLLSFILISLPLCIYYLSLDAFKILFSILPFFVNLIIMISGMIFFMFIPLVVCWDSCLCWFIVIIKFGKISSIILLSIFQLLSFFMELTSSKQGFVCRWILLHEIQYFAVEQIRSRLFFSPSLPLQGK